LLAAGGLACRAEDDGDPAGAPCWGRVDIPARFLGHHRHLGTYVCFWPIAVTASGPSLAVHANKRVGLKPTSGLLGFAKGKYLPRWIEQAPELFERDTRLVDALVLVVMPVLNTAESV
jgi:hypothetical protein